MIFNLRILTLVFCCSYIISCKTKYEEIPPKLPKKNVEIVPVSKADIPWELITLSKDTIQWNSFDGKIIFLNFWGTWCAPCRAELPAIQNLYNQLDKNKFKFLLVTKESPEIVREFVSKNDYTLPFYISEEIPQEEFPVTMWPTTYILNQQQQVLFKYEKTAKWDSQNVIEFLNGLTTQ